MLDVPVIQRNISSIYSQIDRFFRSSDPPDSSNLLPVQIVNNADWWTNISSLSLLRDIGKHMKISAMLAKDSVQQRLQQEQSISYTEFSYQLLQAYDFVHLNRQHGVTMQIGGSDQWGNISAGIDLANRMRSPSRKNSKADAEQRLAGLTIPLLTTSSGEKFGKSAGNALFLDAKLTTPLQMYQYLLNQPDADIRRLLMWFTFDEIEQIDQLMDQHQQRPESRAAQRHLARSVIKMLHGESEVQRAEQLSSVLFGDEQIVDWLCKFSEVERADALNALVNAVPNRQVADVIGKTVVDVLIPFRPCKSTAELKQLFSQNAVLVNGQAAQVDHVIQEHDLLESKAVIINIAKRFFAVSR